MEKAYANLKILIADDSSTMRIYIQNLLEKIGLKSISCVEDGKEAVEKLQSEEFDLLLCDWNMPRMNGLEVVKAVRADKNIKHVPIIMITAEGLKANIVAAVQAGANEYVTKPFTEKIIRKKINNVIKA